MLSLPDDLVAAAWLHDIGYAPELAKTGFHPLDGSAALAARIHRTLPVQRGLDGDLACDVPNRVRGQQARAARRGGPPGDIR
jgi:hypothetical protein